MDIEGHSAIVTGGASGLGAATARTIVEAGGKLYSAKKQVKVTVGGCGG